MLNALESALYGLTAALDNPLSHAGVAERSLALCRVLDALEAKNNHVRHQLRNDVLSPMCPVYGEATHVHFTLSNFVAAHKQVFLKAAALLREQGREEMASMLLRRLITALPDLKEARRGLEELAVANGDRNSLSFLEGTLFHRSGGFSLFPLSKPYDACFDPEGELLYVTDIDKGRVHSFAADGSGARLVEGSWASAWGIAFHEGLLHVCDHDGHALHVYSPRDGTAMRFDIQALLEGISERVKPEFAAVLEGRIYLMTSNRRYRDYEMISFLPGAPRESLRLHREVPLDSAGGLAVLGNEILAATSDSPAVYALDPSTGAVRVMSVLPSDYALNIAAGKDRFHVTHTRGLLTFDMAGKHLRTLSGNVHFGDNSVYQGMALWRRKGRDRLFLINSAESRALVLDV